MDDSLLYDSQEHALLGELSLEKKKTTKKRNRLSDDDSNKSSKKSKHNVSIYDIIDGYIPDNSNVNNISVNKRVRDNAKDSDLTMSLTKKPKLDVVSEEEMSILDNREGSYVRKFPIDLIPKSSLTSAQRTSKKSAAHNPKPLASAIKNNKKADNQPLTNSVYRNISSFNQEITQSKRVLLEDKDLTITVPYEIRTKCGKVVPRELCYVIGIDPGSVNGGACLWDVYTNRCVEVKGLSFRASGENFKSVFPVLKSLKAHLNECKNTFYKCNNIKNFQHIFIEDQNENVFGKNEEVVAIQYGLCYAFGDENARLVKPKSVKDWHSDVFPEVESKGKDDTVARKKQRQYALNKKNAVLYGKELLPMEMNQAIRAHHSKLDDIYDSIWIAKYASEFFFDRINLLTGEIIPILKMVVSRKNQTAPKKRKEPNKRKESKNQTSPKKRKQPNKRKESNEVSEPFFTMHQEREERIIDITKSTEMMDTDDLVPFSVLLTKISKDSEKKK